MYGPAREQSRHRHEAGGEKRHESRDAGEVALETFGLVPERDEIGEDDEGRHRRQADRALNGAHSDLEVSDVPRRHEDPRE